MLTYLLFLLGFVLLIKGADWLVDGACAIARKFNISDLVIGLTVVAFGTSAPELFVNIVASAGGNAGIAIGNVLGSNICNVLLILGISAVIYPLSVSNGTVWKEIPFSMSESLVGLTIVAVGTSLPELATSAFCYGFPPFCWKKAGNSAKILISFYHDQCNIIIRG